MVLINLEEASANGRQVLLRAPRNRDVHIDFIDHRALVGVPVALLATGGSDRHALVIEHQLRPLFAFFQAQPLGTGFFLSDRDLSSTEISDPKLIARRDQLVREAVDALGRRDWRGKSSELPAA